MGDAARHLLKTFEALSETEQAEVLAQLLRRAAELPHLFPSDEELLSAADQVFQELDHREARGAISYSADPPDCLRKANAAGIDPTAL